MEKHKRPQINRMHAPTRQDRLVVLFLSMGIFLLLLPLARNIHPQAIGWIVMVIVLGLPVVTINVLLPFGRWEKDESLTCHKESRRDPSRSLRSDKLPERHGTTRKKEEVMYRQIERTMSGS
jgi:hypothetical protein